MDLVHLIKWYSTKPVFQSPRGVLGGAGLPTNTTGYTSLPDQFLSRHAITFFIYTSTRTTVHCCCPQLDTLAAALLQSMCLRSPGPLVPAKTDGSSHPGTVLLRLEFAPSLPKHGQPQVLLPDTGYQHKAEWPVRSHSPAALGEQGLHGTHFPLSCLNPVSQVLVNTHVWGDEGGDDGIRFVLKTDICLFSSLFFLEVSMIIKFYASFYM